MPYQYKDASGKLTGLDNDFLYAVAKQAGCKVAIKNMPWKRALNMLKIGKLDMTAGASKTVDREKFVYYSSPYRAESIAVYLLEMNKDKYVFNDLKSFFDSNVSIGVTRGYHYGKAFTELSENDRYEGQISESSSDEESLKKLKAGRIDAILMDKYVGDSLIKSLGLKDRVFRHEMPLRSEDIFLFFLKNECQRISLKNLIKHWKK